MKKYLLGALRRLKEPTSWASIAAMVALVRPELAGDAQVYMGAAAAVLGFVIPEAGGQ